MGDVAAARLAGVIGGFYDAAAGAGSWETALADLAQYFDGSRAWMFSLDGTTISRRTSIADPEFHSEKALNAMVSDPLFRHVRRPPGGSILRQAELEDLDAFYRRPLFNDWLRPRDVFFGLQTYLKVAPGRRVFLDVSRGRRQGDFADVDKRNMAIFSPHILRAGEIAEMVASTGRPTLDDFAPASMVLNQRLRVIDTNAAAEQLLDRYPDVAVVRHGRLHLRSPESARRIRGLVQSVAISPGGSAGGIMVVGHPGENADRLVLSVAPFATAEPFGLSSDACALVSLRPVAAVDDDPIDATMIELFGLNPRQARLARALLTGRSLRQAAAERGISYASARTYLEHIFRKTGTRQQSELVALMKTLQAAREY